DEIQIARAGFFMIHNAWTGVWGNRNDMRETADFLEQIDETIADIYSIRTGLSIDELKAQMDKESWINGKNSVEQGFADSYLDSDVVEEGAANSVKDRIAAHKIDLIMAKAGITRSERRDLMKDFKGTPSAAKEQTTPSASLDLSGLIEDMRTAAQKF
ncbi:ATP-dependent Clp protease proteolytic subunit, partial [Acinetobacter baumannii]